MEENRVARGTKNVGFFRPTIAATTTTYDYDALRDEYEHCLTKMGSSQKTSQCFRIDRRNSLQMRMSLTLILATLLRLPSMT